MRWAIGVKFCMVISTRPNFIMPIQNFGVPTPKNFRGQKREKFGPISDDFRLRRRISPERTKIFKIGHFVPRFLSRWVKKVWGTLVH